VKPPSDASAVRVLVIKGKVLRVPRAPQSSGRKRFFNRDTSSKSWSSAQKRLNVGAQAEDPRHFSWVGSQQDAMTNQFWATRCGGKKKAKLAPMEATGRGANGLISVQPPRSLADVDPKARISQKNFLGPCSLNQGRAKISIHAPLEIAQQNRKCRALGELWRLPANKEKNGKKKAQEVFPPFRQCVSESQVHRPPMVGPTPPSAGFNMSVTDSKTGGQGFTCCWFLPPAQSQNVAQSL